MLFICIHSAETILKLYISALRKHSVSDCRGVRCMTRRRLFKHQTLKNQRSNTDVTTSEGTRRYGFIRVKKIVM